MLYVVILMLEEAVSPMIIRAFTTALLASIISAVIGVFIVLRRLSAIGAATAHMGFAGAMWSFVIRVNPILGALAFSVLQALGTSYARTRRRGQSEAIISAAIGSSSALAALALAFSKEYSSVAFSYLAGDVLGVSLHETISLIFMVLIVLLIIAFFYRGLKYSSLDPETAEAAGMHTWFYEYFLGVVTALVLVFEMRAVGMILAQVYLVAPAAAAWELTHSLENMILAAVGIGALAAVTGFFIALALNLPISAVIGLIAALLYIAVLLVSPKRRGLCLPALLRRERRI